MKNEWCCMHDVFDLPFALLPHFDVGLHQYHRNATSTVSNIER